MSLLVVSGGVRLSWAGNGGRRYHGSGGGKAVTGKLRAVSAHQWLDLPVSERIFYAEPSLRALRKASYKRRGR